MCSIYIYYFPKRQAILKKKWR